MYIVLESSEVTGYIQAYHELIQKGCQRFLIYGITPVTIEFFNVINNAPAKEGTTFTISGSDHKEHNLKLRTLETESAFLEQWDAIIIFSIEDSHSILAKINTLNYRPDVIYHGKRADYLILVTLPKCGSHLIGRLIQKLGFYVYGPGGIEKEDPFTLSPDQIATFELIKVKLGMRLSVLNFNIYDKVFREQDKEFPKRDFLSLPRNSCLSLHSLSLDKIEFEIFHQMINLPIIFNYRDPRDMIMSYIYFLMKKSVSGSFGRTPPQIVHSEILQSLPDTAARIKHAITETTFPFSNVFRECSWLLRHPRVCKVTFERLIGKDGGGNDKSKLCEVIKVMNLLNISGEPEHFASQLFEKSVPVFFRGQIGSWREEFSPEHINLFNNKFGDILELYGYE